jgi:hypothetical protein
LLSQEAVNYGSAGNPGPATRLGGFDAGGGCRHLNRCVYTFSLSDTGRVRAVENVATAGSIYDLNLEGRVMPHRTATLRIPASALTGGHHTTRPAVFRERVHHGRWLLFARNPLSQVYADDEMIYLAHQVRHTRPVLALNVADHGNLVCVSQLYSTQSPFRTQMINE